MFSTQINLVAGAVPDDYENFFNQIQAKQEAYESFVAILPNVASGEAQRLISEALQSQAPAGIVPCTDNDTQDQGLQRLPAVPRAPDLQKEWEAAAEDVDDLSTESGDWVDVEGQEDVDEDGVAVVPQSRAASSCILDAPGEVQVDNFCVEDEEAVGPGPTGAPTAENTGSSYLPSALKGAGADAPAGPVASRRALGARARLSHSTPEPVQLLSDTARQFRDTAAAATAHTTSTSAPNGQGGGSGGAASQAAAPAAAHAGGARSSSKVAEAEDDRAQAEPTDPSGEPSAATGSKQRPVLLDAQSLPGMPGPDVQVDEERALADQLLHAVDHEAGMLAQMGLGVLPANEAEAEAEAKATASCPAVDRAPALALTCAVPLVSGRPELVAGAGGTGQVDSSAVFQQGASRQVDAEDSVEYVDVEAFSLDDNFDYDNCPLTERAWPYNLLNRPAPFQRGT